MPSTRPNTTFTILGGLLQDQRTAAPFYQRLAAHFEQAESLEEAERFYIKAGLARQVPILSAFFGLHPCLCLTHCVRFTTPPLLCCVHSWTCPMCRILDLSVIVC